MVSDGHFLGLPHPVQACGQSADMDPEATQGPCAFQPGLPGRAWQEPRSHKKWRKGNWCPGSSRFLREWTTLEIQASVGIYSLRAVWGALFTSGSCTPFSTAPCAGIQPQALWQTNCRGGIWVIYSPGKLGMS